MMRSTILPIVGAILALATMTSAFSVSVPSSHTSNRITPAQQSYTSSIGINSNSMNNAFMFQSEAATAQPAAHSSTRLYMSDKERSKTTKKGVQVIDKIQSQAAEEKKKEEMWRVVLHNDEVHTFNYVIRSLCKVVGTLDRKASFEICVQTHGIGKATVTKTWKKQAEQFCLGLQRQGLTVSIAPDEDFDGGHSGGGL